MLGIILMILGIIGKILLIILAVILILAALILFVPVTYRAKAQKEEAIRAEADAGWLFRLLHVIFSYDSSASSDRKMHLQIRAAWFTVFDNRKKAKKKRQTYRKKTAPAEDRSAAQAEAPPQIEDRYPDEYTDDIHESPHEQEADEDIGTGDSEPAADEAAGNEKDHISFAEKIRGFFRQIAGRLKKAADALARIPGRIGGFIDRLQDMPENIWDKLAGISDRISEIDDKKEKIMILIDDEGNRRWFEKSLVRIKKLLIYLLPVPERIYLHFGSGDPAQTGRIMGYLSLLYPLCPDGMRLTPEFEDKVMEGELQLHGHIMLIRVLIYMLPVVLNKKFFSLVKKIKAL